MSNRLMHGIGYVSDNTGNADVPRISVNDPDNAHNVPIYDGPARNAWKYLIPGVYAATTVIDSFHTMLDVLLIVHGSGSYVADSDGIALSGRINA
jgi:hypothetical protein